MAYSIMSDFDFNAKKVLVRTGFDVPVKENGDISDDRRIRISIPTIKYLLDHDASQIIIMFHIGRPKAMEEKLSSTKTAERLSDILGLQVAKIDDWGENGIPDERLVVLENVRFNPAEKSKDTAEMDEFSKHLSSLADIFVMDAFSNMHHANQASMAGVIRYLPSCLGLSAQKEIETIVGALENPERPFVSIVGGLKAEKLNAVHNLLKNVDKVLIAGALAFTVLKTQGYEMGSSKVDMEGLDAVKELVDELKGNPKVMLPTDAVVADRFDNEAQSKIVPIDKIRPGWMALDIGPQTVAAYKKELEAAKTIIWNGPIGVFEFENFAKGTKEIAATLAGSGAKVIVGGGDSADVIDKLGLEDKITFVSTGGGASLEMFEGKKLSVLKYLEENHDKFSR